MGASYFVLNEYYHYKNEVCEIGSACVLHGTYRNSCEVLISKMEANILLERSWPILVANNTLTQRKGIV